MTRYELERRLKAAKSEREVDELLALAASFGISLATDSAILGGIVGSLLGGSATTSIIGGLLGDGLDGDLWD